jgi:hypothetical protein
MSKFHDKQLSPAAQEFLIWAADDYTEIFVLRTVLQRVNGPLNPEEERTAGMKVVRELLEAGSVKVGEMQADVSGLVYWEGTNSELEARIGLAWSAEQPPSMGEGPWFNVSRDGKWRVEIRD